MVSRVRKMPARPVVNEALRGHVTRVGFDLTLGRTHVAALVALKESIEAGHWLNTGTQSVFSHFVSGMHGCERRGLIRHHYRQPEWKNGVRSDLPPGEHYTITTAGELVVGLLREAGVYDEYAALLPRSKAS